MYKLVKPPVVRRINYINDYLIGVKNGLDDEDLMTQLAETKKRLEREKSIAVGRGNPYRKGITRTKNLTYDCKRLTESMKLVENNTLTRLGEQYLNSDPDKRRQILCEAYSSVYPHLGVLVTVLQKHESLVLPLRNTPPFRPEVKKYELNTHQVAFDTMRDFATEIGLVNWYTQGKAENRRQYIYLVCKETDSEDPHYKIHHKKTILYFEPNTVNINKFRETLWDNYLELVNWVPGFPVFFSEIRNHVCSELKLSDQAFNKYTETLIDDDDKYNVIWSQGILPRKQDSASMLKSLPPKNIDGNYVIYLKIVRH